MSGRVPRTVADFWWLGAGFLAWSAKFALLYALLSFGCAFGWEQTPVGPFSLQRVLLVGTWLLCILVAGLLVWLSWRALKAAGRHDFPRLTGFALGVTALAVTVANFAPVTVLSSCL